MADALRRSPLDARARDLASLASTTGGRIAASEAPFLSQLDLRVDPSLAERLRLALPVAPNTATAVEPNIDVLWIGPDEWLIVSPPDSGTAIAEELDAALAGAHHSIVDVSANRAVLDLSGEGRRDVLSQGCPLDLHPSRWRAGMCAGTMLGRAQVVLYERETSTRAFVRASFGDYVVEWLIEAARGHASG
jgi:sarcosine oxidase, subunit gamma